MSAFQLGEQDALMDKPYTNRFRVGSVQHTDYDEGYSYGESQSSQED